MAGRMVVLARVEMRVRPARIIRARPASCAVDRVIGAVRALAPAVEDAQHERFGRESIRACLGMAAGWAMYTPKRLAIPVVVAACDLHSR